MPSGGVVYPFSSTLNLKRETIKDLNRRDRKKVKGGGGAAGGVVQGRVVGSNL